MPPYRWADARGEKFDLIGALIYAVAVVSIMLGIGSLPDLKSLLWVVLGVTAFYAFVRWESAIQFPVVDVTLFRDNRMFAFVFLGPTTSLGYIIGCLALFGLGFAFFSSPNTNAIMSSVEKRYIGIASGTTGTMRSLGMMFSMGISTVIFSVFIGRVQITPDQYPALMKSVTVAFSIFTILCFLGIFASFVRGKQAG